MPLHNGPIAVHFHGGFLDGHVSRSGARSRVVGMLGIAPEYRGFGSSVQRGSGRKPLTVTLDPPRGETRPLPAFSFATAQKKALRPAYAAPGQGSGTAEAVGISIAGRLLLHRALRPLTSGVGGHCGVIRRLADQDRTRNTPTVHRQNRTRRLDTAIAESRPLLKRVAMWTAAGFNTMRRD